MTTIQNDTRTVLGKMLRHKVDGSRATDRYEDTPSLIHYEKKLAHYLDALLCYMTAPRGGKRMMPELTGRPMPVVLVGPM